MNQDIANILPSFLHVSVSWNELLGFFDTLILVVLSETSFNLEIFLILFLKSIFEVKLK